VWCKKGCRIGDIPGNTDVINVVNRGGTPTDGKEYLEKTRSLLLGTLFYEQKLFVKYSSKIDITLFENPLHKKIYSYIKDCSEKGEKVSNSYLLSTFDTKEDINAVSGILALDLQSDDSDKAVNDYINQIKEKAGPERAMELLQEGKITLEEFNKMINNKG